MIFKLSIMFIFSILLSSDTPEAVEDNRKYQLIPSIGDKELVFLDGKSVDFSDLYKDGPLLLSFWFLGCGPCVAEMKHLSKFNAKYNDTGFKVISVNTDTRNKGKVKSFFKKKKYTFDMVFDLNGKNGVLKKFGGSSCPYTVLVNTDGTIYSKHLGYERGDEIMLEKEIKELIKYNKSISSLDSINQVDEIKK